jgi:putative hydrolase of the HAD superfamily
VPRAVPGAVPLLAALAGRVRVGVVSNNLFDEQLDKLKLCGLEPFVHALIVSERVGVSKPDPAIFTAALEAVGCRANEAVMVGDSWIADIAGARAAGIRPVWFNPMELALPDGAEPVAQLRSLEPVNAVMRTLGIEG